MDADGVRVLSRSDAPAFIVDRADKLIVGVACEMGYRAHYQDRVDRNPACITLSGVASRFDQIRL